MTPPRQRMIGVGWAGKRNTREGGNGAQGRNRTTDTAIFSRMLYQLSYLGSRAAAHSPCHSPDQVGSAGASSSASSGAADIRY